MRLVAARQRRLYVVEGISNVGHYVTDNCGQIIVTSEREKVPPYGQEGAILIGLDISRNIVRLLCITQPDPFVLEFCQMLLCPPELDPPRSSDCQALPVYASNDYSTLTVTPPANAKS